MLIGNDFYQALDEYAAYPCLHKNSACLPPLTPYCRSLCDEALASINTQPIQGQEIVSLKNLAINQLLFTINEQDLLFLTNLNTEFEYNRFKMFYDPDFVALGKWLKPCLEYLAFSFLDEVSLSGLSSASSLRNYFINQVAEYEASESKLCVAIMESQYPLQAIKLMFTQMAPDFLSEASAMGRALLGSFGREQSELMKIFIDEYGYGQHHKKHSTLFEATLNSINLHSMPHFYYHHYLVTSLMISNYFHFLCSNRANCFKHMGALYYSEVVIPHYNKQISTMLREYAPGVAREYFDEHVHIDMHHSRMVLAKIIEPAIHQYGECIIEDIVHGFKAARLLFELADEEIIQQINLIQSKERTDETSGLYNSY